MKLFASFNWTSKNRGSGFGNATFECPCPISTCGQLQHYADLLREDFEKDGHVEPRIILIFWKELEG